MEFSYKKHCFLTINTNKMHLKFIFDKELHARTDLLSIIRSLNTVFTTIGICHNTSSYVVC